MAAAPRTRRPRPRVRNLSARAARLRVRSRPPAGAVLAGRPKLPGRARRPVSPPRLKRMPRLLLRPRRRSRPSPRTPPVGKRGRSSTPCCSGPARYRPPHSGRWPGAPRPHRQKLPYIYPRVCFKTVKVTRQGYRQGRQQPGNKELFSHIWWQSGGSF